MKTIHRKLALASLLTATMLTPAAQAGGDYEQTMREAAASESGSKAGMRAPLQNAVKQIVPSHFNITFGAGVDWEQRVSWVGSGDWRRDIKSIAYDTGLAVDIDGRNVAITLAGPGHYPAKPVANVVYERPQGSTGLVYKPNADMGTKQSAGGNDAAAQYYAGQTRSVYHAEDGVTTTANTSTTHYVKGAVPDINGEYEAAPAPVEHGRWEAEAGGTLKMTMHEWSKRAGWTLVWQSDYRYQIQSGAVIEGSFKDATKKLVSAMNAIPAVHVQFFNGNKTIVVTDKPIRTTSK